MMTYLRVKRQKSSQVILASHWSILVILTSHWSILVILASHWSIFIILAEGGDSEYGGGGEYGSYGGLGSQQQPEEFKSPMMAPPKPLLTDMMKNPSKVVMLKVLQTVLVS